MKKTLILSALLLGTFSAWSQRERSDDDIHLKDRNKERESVRVERSTESARERGKAVDRSKSDDRNMNRDSDRKSRQETASRNNSNRSENISRGNGDRNNDHNRNYGRTYGNNNWNRPSHRNDGFTYRNNTYRRPYGVYGSGLRIGWGFGLYDRTNNNFDWNREAVARINYGLDRGLLTRAECRRLYRMIDDIQDREYRYLNNGYLSNRELRILDDEIRDLQSEIRYQINDDDYNASNYRHYDKFDDYNRW